MRYPFHLLRHALVKQPASIVRISSASPFEFLDIEGLLAHRLTI